MNKELRLANLKIIGFVVIAFLAGTITSGAIASADKDKDHPNPITTLAAFCAKMDDKTGFPALVCTAFSSLETQITNISLTPGPQGPPGTSVTVTPEPSGPHCANGGVKLTSVSGINYICNGGSSGPTCTGGNNVMCGNTCVNTQSDNNNCGACGNACTGGMTCSAGVCVTPACGPNQTTCNGACTAVTTDTHNCGSCGNVCPNSFACISGACVPPVSQCTSAATCPQPSNSCQQATCTAGTCGFTNSLSGTVCSATNAIGMCNGLGTCSITSCNAGFANCDQNPANGCESNLQSDINNCGSCGTVCAKSQTCTSGVCQ